MYISRESEFAELNKLYRSTGFKFAVMYGRRRVGKTALISEFAKDKDSILYIALEQNDKAALETFSTKVLERFPAAASMLDCFPSWDKAFSYVAEQAGNSRIVLSIDEYPYLATGYPAISSVLQKHIDTSFATSNMFLILCGSSMSFMENQVLGYKSPLYGRRHAQFLIEPFDYYDAGKFFPQASCEEKMLAYAVCGGVPHYLNALAGSDSVENGIYECFLKKTGMLYEEPENLLKQELREPAVYNTLIESIARGASKLNEISTKSGEDNKKCSKYLKSLLDLRIVRKEQPHPSDKERNAIYILSDNMFRFWYRFIPKNVTTIESGLGRQLYEKRISPDLQAYVGRVFEDACRDYMRRINGTDELPFMFDSIGRWWGTNPATKSQEEIDIVADCGESAIFGECKWTTAEVGMDTFVDLQRKSEMFNRYADKKYALFSKNGFTPELTKNTDKDKPLLIDLPRLYRDATFSQYQHI